MMSFLYLKLQGVLIHTLVTTGTIEGKYSGFTRCLPIEYKSYTYNMKALGLKAKQKLLNKVIS